MNIDDMEEIKDLRSLVDITDSTDNDGDWEILDGVLCRSTALAISNYGGELKDVLERLSEECSKANRYVFVRNRVTHFFIC